MLLKGAKTFIASPNQPLYVAEAETHYLATAGSGDVLAGILGGLLALEHASTNPRTSAEIAALGCALHSRSAALINGGFGPTPASLIAEQVPAAIASYLMCSASMHEIF